MTDPAGVGKGFRRSVTFDVGGERLLVARPIVQTGELGAADDAWSYTRRGMRAHPGLVVFVVLMAVGVALEIVGQNLLGTALIIVTAFGAIGAARSRSSGSMYATDFYPRELDPPSDLIFREQNADPSIRASTDPPVKRHD